MPYRVPNVNHITLTARLTMPPELKYTPSGKPVLNMYVAYNRSWKDKNDEWKQEASFFGVECWGPQVESLSEKLVKGSAVMLEGELRQRSWESKDGEKRSVVYILARRVSDCGKSDKSAQQSGSESEAPADEYAGRRKQA